MPDSPDILVFGEVLFDCFDDQQVLGGAPFNVAWNLKGLSLNPLFVGAVGHDALGQRVIASMRAWHMSLAGLGMSENHPTGRVEVHLKNGEPSYKILADQAYDHIDASQVLEKMPQHGLLYHGSLALRGEVSRQNFQHLCDQTQPRIFLDVNLRDPWWQHDEVVGYLQQATWAKLNEQELAILSSRPESAPIEQAQCLRDECQLEAVIVTRAAQGAFVVSRDGSVFETPAPAVPQLIDTVGAGDAFTAVTLIGLIEAWPWPLILQRASVYAAAICAMRGATTDDPLFYIEAKSDWS